MTRFKLMGDWSFTAVVIAVCACPAPLSAQDRPHVLGSLSCGNATCHGNLPGRGGVWRSSHTLWELADPHAKAGLVLLEPASQRIVRALDPSATTAERQLAVLVRRCFSCHTTVSAIDSTAGETAAPTFATTARQTQDILVEGVSCESCHGPASKWIKQHVMSSWSGPDKYDPSTGMFDTESWLPRVAGCARCHIGSRTADDMIRDVNHDLIAAGHPAMRFDGLLYNLNLPKHWDEGREGARSSSQFRQTVLHESARWKALAAAAALARERLQAHPADASVPWPELADYDCFGCHHQLRLDNDHRRSPRRGKAAWNAWYTAGRNGKLPGELSSVALGKVGSAQLEKLDQIELAANELAASTMRHPPAKPVTMLRSAVEQGHGITDWYDGAAWYLHVRAALADCQTTNALPQPIGKDVEALVLSLVNTTLQFSTPDVAMQSPRAFRADRMAETRQQLSRLLLQAESP